MVAARTVPARFARLFVILILVLAGCARVGPEARAERPGGGGPVEVVIEPGPISGPRQAEAAGLYDRAAEALEAGRAGEAGTLARRVVEEYPRSSSSGRALWLLARAAVASGDAAAGDEAAARYLGLDGVERVEDPRPADVALLRAEATADRPAASIERLFPIGSEAPNDAREAARERARAAAALLSLAETEDLLARAPADAAVRGVLAARRAAYVLLDGNDRERAAALAREALAAGATGPDSVLAEAVSRGELPEDFVSAATLRIGAIFPLGGAPSLASYAELLMEGVEVAAATALGPGFEVELVTRDDEGDPDRTAALVRELEAEGVSGIVGFLQDFDLATAAGARRDGVPLVSPTARVLDGDAPGVYSLEGVDGDGIGDLARYAAERGYQRVAVIRPSAPLAAEEARLFAEAAARFGVPVTSTFTYVEGATFFEPQIIQARDALRAAEIRALGLTETDTLRVEMLEPVALFLPIPREDVELVAPQIVHFGLDTLGIEILGTSGWTDPAVLSTVDTRHTNEVVATAAVGAGATSPAFERFREAYEDHFQRTLVSTVPALGYDAALVLLEALRLGRTSPQSFAEVLERIDTVEGATGAFSATGGRLHRRTRIVELRNGAPVPIPGY